MNSDKENEEVSESKVVIYEDLSMERGAFLIQQAMRVIFLVHFFLLRSFACDINVCLNISLQSIGCCFFYLNDLVSEWCELHFYRGCLKIFD